MESTSDVFAFRGLEDANTISAHPFANPDSYFPPEGFQQLDCIWAQPTADQLLSPTSMSISPNPSYDQTWRQDYPHHVDGAPSFWPPAFSQDFSQQNGFDSMAPSPTAMAYPSPETLLSDHSSPVCPNLLQSRRSKTTTRGYERSALQRPSASTKRQQTQSSQQTTVSKQSRGRNHPRKDISPAEGLNIIVPDIPHEAQLIKRKHGSDPDSDKSGDDENGMEGKGPNHRVKNRAAAKRCRDKSRKQEKELIELEKSASAKHQYLNGYVTELKEEVLFLKNEILRHGDCRCEMIELYISKAASKIN